jgi:hypothetical protein
MKMLFSIPYMILDKLGYTSPPPVNKRLSVFESITGRKAAGSLSPTSADSDSEINFAEKANIGI